MASPSVDEKDGGSAPPFPGREAARRAVQVRERAAVENVALEARAGGAGRRPEERFRPLGGERGREPPEEPEDALEHAFSHSPQPAAPVQPDDLRRGRVSFHASHATD